ncbi:MAG: hypothetical protein QM300_13910 [Pseudomonadota bacterium]|jgi:hypothetical protein|nr:hypothetical protein [Pseudomonadota bacterium]
MRNKSVIMNELRALLESRGVEHTDDDLISIMRTIFFYARKVMPRNWDWEKKQDWDDEALQIGYMAILEAHNVFDPGKKVPFVVWVVEYIRLRIFEAFSSHVIVETVEIVIKSEHRRSVLSLMGLIVMDRAQTLDKVPLMLTGDKIRNLNDHLHAMGYDCRFATKKNQRPSEISVWIVNGVLHIAGDRKRYADYSPIDELAAKTILPEELVAPEEKFYIDGESKSEIEWNKLSQRMDVISDEAMLRAYAALPFEHRTVLRSRHGIFGARKLVRSEYADTRLRTPQRVHQIERKAMVDLRNKLLSVKPDEEAMHEC